MKVQSKCMRCNHAKSFHDGGIGECFAMSCSCEGMPTLVDALDGMTRDQVREIAKSVDLPEYSKVRQNKQALIEALAAHAEETASAGVLFDRRLAQKPVKEMA